ncbi:MAG TPA: nitrate reductase molybdenum cofactor assembly chaperone [Burkholderiales bacterium]|nr:nitrate reductase molybdenum cofactor assembly chaperone [Burkholderiales bacterium]
MKTLRVCAVLLSYPEPELLSALPELSAALDAERLLPRAAQAELEGLLDELRREPLGASQERYVTLFDRARALSLHLFEHVHGESRDRGQAMVDLAAMYRARGLAVDGRELPDYLPAFLEFASLLPAAEARGLLGESADILRALGERLAARGSRYCAVFAALLALAGERGLALERAARPRAGEEDSPEAVDRSWLEQPVTFGGAAPQVAPVHVYRKGAAS